MLFDKIAGEYGIDFQVSHGPDNRRIKFLDWLKKNSIKSHIEVTRHVVLTLRASSATDFSRKRVYKVLCNEHRS